MKLVSGSLSDRHIYMVGIKGTGMSALAELLKAEGARVQGSDVPEEFYTDAILRKNGIEFFSGFSADQVPPGCELVVYSSAYDPAVHPELLRAASLGRRMLEYSQALGEYSGSMKLGAVAGIHGKTTTTAMIGTIMKQLNLPGRVLAGSALSNFDGSPTWSGGDRFMVAETCEYRRHFLNFSPRHLVITSIEADHLDYFRDEDDVALAFRQFMDRLPSGGKVIYCHDDDGARRTVEAYLAERSDLIGVPYGFSAPGDWAVRQYRLEPGYHRFRTGAGGTEFRLPYPGRHSVLNAVAASALVLALNEEEQIELGDVAMALEAYRGTSRRSELVAEVSGVRIMDDYAHHPSAIRATLAGYREFYPGRRLVVDFMSHTYSRTAALLEEFASCFSDADILLLNDIYASAREQNSTGISGRTLYERSREHHAQVHYEADFEKAARLLASLLRTDDILVTMGAGDNWRIGRRVAQLLG